MGETRGSIAFFATYRPPVALDLYACPIPPTSKTDEVCLTDGISYNSEGHPIPTPALKLMLTRPKLASAATAADVDSGRVTGLMFVSERTDNLETLHISLRIGDQKPKVFNFADVYDTFKGVRMEDRPCFGGEYIIYVTTKDDPIKHRPNKDDLTKRRQPWTAVYRTHLKDGKTERLTPSGVADLSPSVSPSGKKIAVASFQNSPWKGEVEALRTGIFVMDFSNPKRPQRKFVLKEGGWPTWATEDLIFFHRKAITDKKWGVYMADVNKGRTQTTPRVTPDDIDAITPVAIAPTKVAVATIRQSSEFGDNRVEAQYRHIEIFDTTGEKGALQITQKTRPKADHFDPFVLDVDGNKRIGYHRGKTELLKSEDDVSRNSLKLLSPNPEVGLFRVGGVFPTFSSDGSKLAFVDNEFKHVWLADDKGLRIVYKLVNTNSFFSPVWNQNPAKDTLYLCMGPSFNAKEAVNIYALPNVSTGYQEAYELTNGFNNAFPYTNPDGTKLVYRSNRDGNKNLYIMEDAEIGEFEGGEITRLTKGDWIDTHCQWSPRGDWIVFSSTRNRTEEAAKDDVASNLDPGCYAVFLVKVDDPNVVVRVVTSATNVAGHVNHPCFSPDGKSLVFVSDLASVSNDPISMPLFIHSVRPYGDIFTVDLTTDDINKNKDIQEFTRVTHSRYENSTASWTKFATNDQTAKWNLILKDQPEITPPTCPYAQSDRGDSFLMTGHLYLPHRCC